MKALAVLANRFKEPSSWAGLAGVVGLFGISAPTGLIQSITLIGAGVCGVIAVLVPEGK
jgi:hypothetical protein